MNIPEILGLNTSRIINVRFSFWLRNTWDNYNYTEGRYSGVHQMSLVTRFCFTDIWHLHILMVWW